MEAIKKQASKLREQVARQQQAILRQLGQLGHGGVMIDDADMELHQQLQNLYKSTRAAKHFQRDIVRGLEGFVSTSKKQMEIARKLAEDCCKYGIENQDSASPLARVASDFGTSHVSMEDHRERMLGTLGYQVSEPLRVLVNGAPLEDARHLTHRYDRMRQEFEIQAAEVIRRQSKSRDTSSENALKLKTAEKKLTETKSSMLSLGREAAAAMSSVEDQQQETTFQKLLTMVAAERTYHQNVIAVLEKLHSEMILEEEMEGISVQSVPPGDNSIPLEFSAGDGDIPSHSDNDIPSKISAGDEKIPSHSDNDIPSKISAGDEKIPSHSDGIVLNRSNGQDDESRSDMYFIAKVIHSFDAQAESELSLEVDDYVVVRQVSSNGWSEGECRGNAGWFPSAYVVKIDTIQTTKLTREDFSV